LNFNKYNFLVGFCSLTQNITLKNLEMLDGSIIAQDSKCPDGWTVGLGSPTAQKCYKLFDNATTYAEASKACRNNGHGSVESRLVLVDSYAEMTLVRGLCRGAGTNAAVLGCWIGLRDIYGNGTFRWEESTQRLKQLTIDRFSYSFTFLDWRRNSRTNITVYEGLNVESFERCVIVYPWGEDPLIQEQGLMEDVSCAAIKSYICQINALTNKYTIQSSTTTLSGGQLIGGTLYLSGSATIDSFAAQNSATIGIADFY